MNHFTIFAHGESFDVDSFLSETSLVMNHVWRRNDRRRHPFVDSKYLTSGIEIELGDGFIIPFLEQERIAIKYIKANKNELRIIGTFPGVNTFILGLQYILKVDSNIVGFSMGPSAELMKIALEIGLIPNYYVTIDHSRELPLKKKTRILENIRQSNRLLVN